MIINTVSISGKGGDGLMDKVSASQMWIRTPQGSRPYDTSTGWFQEARGE